MILQKQIQTSKATILVIGGIDTDVKILRSAIEVLTVALQNENFDTSDYIIPFGNWKPLGFLKDITEDMAKELVEEHYMDGIRSYTIYNDYCTNNMCWFDNAIKSLHSFIEANCKLENIWGDKPDKNFERYHKVWNEQCFDREWYENDLNRWNKEQEKVFTNPYLLLKHN